MDVLGPFVLFANRVEIWAPFTWNVETNSPSIEGFGISMAMATIFIDPWRASTNILSSGQRIIPSQLENNAFTYAHAFKHITTPICPLPSC